MSMPKLVVGHASEPCSFLGTFPGCPALGNYHCGIIQPGPVGEDAQ